MRSLRYSLVAAAVAIPLLSGGLASAAPAETTGVVSGSAVSAAAAKNRAPEIRRSWVTCGNPEGAKVTVRLRSRSSQEASFMLGISGPVDQSQAVTLPPRATQNADFDGLPDGTYTILVFNDVGDVVATGEIVVACLTPYLRP